MYVLFQAQWAVVILVTCYTLAHAAPKRARSVPTREVHARQEPVEQSEHACYGDLNVSFKAWQGRGKKRRTAGHEPQGQRHGALLARSMGLRRQINA